MSLEIVALWNSMNIHQELKPGRVLPVQQQNNISNVTIDYARVDPTIGLVLPKQEPLCLKTSIYTNK